MDATVAPALTELSPARDPQGILADTPTAPAARVADVHGPRTGWIGDIRQRILRPDGWLMVSKFVISIGGVLGLLFAVLSYRLQARVALIDGAERSYTKLIDDFGSESEHVRMGALARAPSVMTKHVPISAQPGMGEALLESFGGGMKTDTVFASETKRLLHTFVRRGTSVGPEELQILRTLPAEGQGREAVLNVSGGLTIREADALIDTLVALGSDGWYRGDVSSRDCTRERGLAWVWAAPPIQIVRKFDTSVTLFDGARIPKLNLKAFDLPGASFVGAFLPKAQFTYARLERGRFSGAVLDFADLAQANLNGAIFDRASMVSAAMAESLLENADFRNADLRNCTLRDAHVRGAQFYNARLDRANLSNVTILNDSSPEQAEPATFQSANLAYALFANAKLPGCRFDRATLDRAAFNSANLDGANLSYVSARWSTFAFASLSGANLSVADLSEANLSNVKGLDSLSACENANIAGVTGLTATDIEGLIARGAVQIPDEAKWEQYKKSGLPHGRWREYASPQKTLTTK